MRQSGARKEAYEYIFGDLMSAGTTHTDKVLLNARQRIIAHTKQPTSVDVMQGIGQTLAALLTLVNVDHCDIHRVMLGTAHCTNAIFERKDLQPVAHFRLSALALLAVPPLSDMPANFLPRAFAGTVVYPCRRLLLQW